ncbi:hypothetical protein HQ531_07950 [bacterium]|nr:hypothetical protein [bacterium]
MNQTLTTLINRLDGAKAKNTGILSWASPIPSFGNLAESRVATLGLNPSNLEYLDRNGDELFGESRRFQTLNSLGISSWGEADSRHMHLIEESCNHYFDNTPYDRWFKVLDFLLGDLHTSYYSATYKACHLDLIPFATRSKWTDLTRNQRNTLFEISEGSLGDLLIASPVRVIILNGVTVVNQFQGMMQIELDTIAQKSWSLPRKNSANVQGAAYSGNLSQIGSIELEQPILVLGYNHNLQSSYGVTKGVLQAIRSWIKAQTKDLLP